MDPNELAKLFNDSAAAFGAGGVMLGLATVLYSAVKVWRAAWMQAVLEKISPRLVWASWPKPLCLALVFVGAGGVAFGAAVAAGTSWLAAVPAAIVAGFSAMGLDAAVGSVARPGASNPS